jgi:polar amino acid transport system substrate-binding protein
MKVPNKALIFVVFVFLIILGRAVASETISVAFGEVQAPWVLAESNEGIIVDIFSSAMAPLGYKVENIYLPYARRSFAYKNGDVDVVSDMNPNTIEQYQLVGFFSDIAYTYENYAFSLNKRHYQLSQLSDLEQYSLLSWQDATVHLGQKYAQMASRNPRYSETFDQAIQVKMLFLERYDIVQMDDHIFDYYRTKMAQLGIIDTSQKVDRFKIFGASPNGFLFRTEKMRDEFNLQLKQLKAIGQYQKIFARYIPVSESIQP